MIRFRVYTLYGGPDEYFLADNIQIEFGIAQNTYRDTLGIDQLHGGTMSRRSPGLDSLAPQAEVEIHPEDADRLGLRDGQLVKISSRRGEVVATAVLTRRSPPGTVFMNFHFREAAANLLTTDFIDPVAKIPEYKVSAVRVEPLEESVPA